MLHILKNNRVEKTKLTICFKKLFCFCVMKVFVFSVRTLRNMKIYLKYLRNQQLNKKVHAWFFTTLEYNMLKLKKTKNSYQWDFSVIFYISILYWRVIKNMLAIFDCFWFLRYFRHFVLEFSGVSWS